MKRVTGLGGVFFKCQDPDQMKQWYQTHLGIPADKYGGLFRWRSFHQPEQVGHTSWSPFAADTKYFAPSQKEFMFNYRVADLEALLPLLKEEGVEVVEGIETFTYGKFAWILDPEGNKIELWEPLDGPFESSETAVES
ncbi:MAG: VOC family protein [Bacteroidota bacterium]